MKPSPYAGWLQLEENDVIVEGDTWQMVGCSASPSSDDIHEKWYGWKLGDLYKKDPGEKEFDLFRKINSPRILPGNAHFAKELPLP